MDRTLTSEEDRSTARRDLYVLLAVFVLMVVGLFGLAAATGWADTRDAILKITGAQLALLLALSMVNYITRALRWHLFARRLGLRTGLTQNTRHFLGGFALTATPGRIGELVRMRWIRRETGWGADRSGPLVLIDRGGDLLAMALLLAISLGLAKGGIAGGVPLILAALAVAYVATHPKLMQLLAEQGYRAVGRFARGFVGLRRASRALGTFRNPMTLLVSACLGIAGWFAECYAFYLLLDWLGAGIDLWMASAIFLFATLAGGLTGAPGGVGGAEAVMIALLALEGVPLAVSVPATLVIRLTTLWFAIALGLLIFPFAERLSARSSHANATA